MMKLILAGWLAIGCAFLWERALLYLKIKELLRVGFLIPFGEECIKYGSAIYFQLSPFFLYLVFGLGEGLYESFNGSKQFQLRLLLAGIFLHGFLGVFFMFQLPTWLSLSLAIGGHSIWNTFIVKSRAE